MAYERLGETPLDYMPCRYGASKLLFRGPRQSLTGRYAAFLGGTETYGKYISRPFPALIAARTGAKCVNFGWPNAGIDVFLNDADILAAAGSAQVVVVQLPPAQNMSNRFYRVHPRRNDRFLEGSAMLRAIYPDVDLTEFHFTRHLLGHLCKVDAGRFGLIRDELQTAWVARMRLLVDRINAPVVLLWFSTHAQRDWAESVEICEDPSFVTARMVDSLRDHVLQVIDVTASPAALDAGTTGMMFTEFEAAAAAELLGPASHEEATDALSPVITEMVCG